MHPEALVCPYTNCGQNFEKPVMVTDGSKLPRETYYACPHCMLRLELMVEACGSSFGHVDIKAADDAMLTAQLIPDSKHKHPGQAVSSTQASRPSKSCRHFLGYLSTRPDHANIPDECAVCPNIMQCYIKRQ